MNGREWTICDAQYLIDRHKQLTYRQIGHVLMRSEMAVEVMANKLGLSKIQRTRPQTKSVKPARSEEPAKRRFTPGAREYLLGGWL